MDDQGRREDAASLSAANDARQREHIDLPCPRVLEHASCLADRRTRGEDVIDEERGLAIDEARVGHGKGTPDVAAALIAAEFHLWPRLPRAHQQAFKERYLQVLREASGEQRRLVELALHETTWVQGHWDDCLVGRHRIMLGKVLERELQERPAQGEFAAVFEEMDGLS